METHFSNSLVAASSAMIILVSLFIYGYLLYQTGETLFRGFLALALIAFLYVIAEFTIRWFVDIKTNYAVSANIHRIQQLIASCFLFGWPIFLESVLELKGRLFRLNRAVALTGVVVTAFFVVMAFHFPDLYISVEKNNPLNNGFGKEGVLYMFRDFCIALMMIYIISLTVIRYRENKKTTVFAFPIIASTLIMILGAASDTFYIHTGNNLDPLNGISFSRFSASISVFIAMSMRAVAKRYVDMFKALIDNEKKYRTTVESANDGIIIIKNGEIIFANKAVENICGYSEEDVLNTPFQIYFPLNIRDKLLNTYKKWQNGEKIDALTEAPLLKKSGGTVLTEMNGATITYENEPAFIVFIRDISERYRRYEERKKHEAQLIKTDKLSGLGQLAAGMAHEINQPLCGLSMGLDNLIFRIQDGDYSDEEITKKLSGFFEHIKRIEKIIEHVRLFSREQQSQNYDAFSLNEAVRNTLSLTAKQYENHSIEIRLNLDENLKPIFGNLYEMEQVLLNLLSNAKDAVDERASIEKTHKKSILFTTYEKDGQSVVSVRDNGVGIAPEIMSEILNPFFTTKPPKKGTGLGLPIVYGLVSKMKGEIALESVVNNFTEIILSFPVYEKEST